MGKIFKILGVELFLEFCIFALLTFIYMMLFPRGASFEFEFLRDLYSIGALWLAVVVYRTIYLQIPITWALCVYFVFKKELYSGLLRASINFTTFVVVMFIASLISDVVSGFLEQEIIHLPLITLFATFLSPLVCPYLFLNSRK